MQVRGNFSDFYLETMLPALKAIIWKRYQDRPKQFAELFTVDSTSRSIEQFSEITGMGLFSKINEGGNVKYDYAMQGFDKTFKPWRRGLGFQVSQDLVEDDKIGLAAKFSNELGRSCSETIELEAAEVFNNAFATVTGADGKVLCAADHPLIKSGSTASNLLSVAAQLSYTSLKMAMLEGEAIRDHSGKLIHVPMKKLVIPPAYRFIAAQLLKSADDPTTANRATNVLRYADDGMPTMFVYRYLTSTTAWFLCAEPADTGLLWLWRRKPYVKGDFDFDSETGKTAMRYKAAHGFYAWQGVFGTPGA